jgi:hypothetical protein
MHRMHNPTPSPEPSASSPAPVSLDGTLPPWPDDGTFYTKERVNEPLVGGFPTAEQIREQIQILKDL